MRAQLPCRLVRPKHWSSNILHPGPIPAGAHHDICTPEFVAPACMQCEGCSAGEGATATSERVWPGHLRCTHAASHDMPRCMSRLLHPPALPPPWYSPALPLALLLPLCAPRYWPSGGQPQSISRYNHLRQERCQGLPQAQVIQGSICRGIVPQSERLGRR